MPHRSAEEKARRNVEFYKALIETNGVRTPAKTPVGSNPLTQTHQSCPICGKHVTLKGFLQQHFPSCAKKNGNPNAACYNDNVGVVTIAAEERNLLHRRRNGETLNHADRSRLSELQNRKLSEWEQKLRDLGANEKEDEDEDEEDDDDQQEENLEDAEEVGMEEPSHGQDEGEGEGEGEGDDEGRGSDVGHVPTWSHQHIEPPEYSQEWIAEVTASLRGGFSGFPESYERSTRIE